MRSYLAAMFVLVLALPATAQPPYYARGTFGDPANDPVNHTDPWADLTHQMIDQTGGHYTATVGDVNTYFPGVVLKYKLANADYSTQSPASSDGAVVTDNNGEVNFNLWTNNGNPWTDGWMPNNGPRAGYQDPGQFGWEINGTFNNWSQAADPNYFLTSQGNGVYTGTFTMQAGSYQYKFREQGSYDVSVGTDFGNGAPNNDFRVWDNGEQWTFKLDLPNGRFQATSNTPTPDLDGDGYVTASDYVLWRKSNGSAAQYTEWRKHFGDTPPPATYFARGSWSGFDTSSPMTSAVGSEYVATISNLTPGTGYTFKLANSSFSIQTPTSDGKVPADANGQIHFHLYDQTSWSDGWNPSNQRRAGYDDPGQFGWELMGDFGFNFASLGSLTNEGNGLYSITRSFGTTGTLNFKFRKQDDWDISVGTDFGNSAANDTLSITAGTSYEFDLDLPHGRWRAIPVSGAGSSLTGSAVPEPASIAMALLAMSLLGAVRRRRSD